MPDPVPLQAIDAVSAASQGGFSYNHGIIWIVAIGMGESRLDRHGCVMNAVARHVNDDGSVDRGWLQLNSVHKDISDADCDDPVKAAAYAFTKLSASGTKFTAWAAYNSGAAKEFFPVASLAYQAWQNGRSADDFKHALDAANQHISELDERIAAAVKALGG